MIVYENPSHEFDAARPRRGRARIANCVEEVLNRIGHGLYGLSQCVFDLAREFSHESEGGFGRALSRAFAQGTAPADFLDAVAAVAALEAFDCKRFPLITAPLGESPVRDELFALGVEGAVSALR